MGKKLNGKVAVVTGASKGIGAAIALELAKEGAAVIVNYSSSKEGAQKVVSEITKQGGKALAVHADVVNPKDVQNLFLATSEAFGKLDILVNNAGAYKYVPIDDFSIEHYHKMFDLNVLGLLMVTKEALKYFGSSGSIVNISSVDSTSAPATGSVYSASKAAVDAITKSLGKELGPRNIRVNCVNPGTVETEGTEAGGFLDDYRKEIESVTPLRRIGQPMDIAPAVAFLASDDASWITGETLYISGGYR